MARFVPPSAGRCQGRMSAADVVVDVPRRHRTSDPLDRGVLVAEAEGWASQIRIRHSLEHSAPAFNAIGERLQNVRPVHADDTLHHSHDIRLVP